MNNQRQHKETKKMSLKKTTKSKDTSSCNSAQYSF